MARRIQRVMRDSPSVCLFTFFPKQWIPLFEWAGAQWEGCSEPGAYVPFFSTLSEQQILQEVDKARVNGQLRLLAELAASSDVVLGETLQRIDSLMAPEEAGDAQIILTTWHGYNRREIRDLHKRIANHNLIKKSIIFLPCSKTRPYTNSRGFLERMRRLEKGNIDLEQFEKIVITSIGPIPEAFWQDEIVMRYDTGVRDIYLILVLLRAMLKNADVNRVIDTLPLVPYGDVIDIALREQRLPRAERPSWLRRRNVVSYRSSFG